jgi:hypothetical protein
MNTKTYYSVTQINIDESGLDATSPWNKIFRSLDSAMDMVKTEYEYMFDHDEVKLTTDDQGGTIVVWCKGQDHGIHHLITPVYIQGE